MSEQGSVPPVRPCSSPVPSSPLEDENILTQILRRLPPLPSSLVRASLVCKLWRRVVRDPGFVLLGNAPLLGFFGHNIGSDSNFRDETTRGHFSFFPLLDPPNRIPAARFSIPLLPAQPFLALPGHSCSPAASRLPPGHFFRGCRHGLAVMLNLKEEEVVIFNPVTRELIHVPFPPEARFVCDAAVVCMAGHNTGQLSQLSSASFKLALLGLCAQCRPFVCLYQSESGMWGDIHWAPATLDYNDFLGMPRSVLIGNALCWSLKLGDTITFCLDTHSLNVIRKPVGIRYGYTSKVFQALRTQDNGLGLAVVSELTIFRLWERKADFDGVVGWVLQKTIELDKLLTMGPHMAGLETRIWGYAEDSNTIFLWTGAGVFMIELNSVKFRKVSHSNMEFPYLPYTSFFTAGTLNSDGV